MSEPISDEELDLIKLIDQCYRLWLSVKYVEVYLKAYDSVAEARHSLGRYFEFYNTERRRQSLDEQTPDTIYNRSADRMAAQYCKALNWLSMFWGPLLLR